MNPLSSLLDIYLPQRVYNREYEAQQAQAQGLLGTPYSAGADDGLGLAGLGQTEQMGTGLLGNQITPMQYAQQMSAIPMYKTQGASMMNNLSSQQAAMDRQMQGQQFGLDNISAIDQARLDQNQAQFMQKFNQQQKQRVGGYGSLKEYGTALAGHQNQFHKEIVPVRSAMEQWQGYNDLYKAKGGDIDSFTGVDDIQSLIALNKILKPNEAMMQDDITNISQAASYLGLGEVVMNKLTGGSGTLDRDSRLAIKDAIDRNSKRQFERYTEIRGRYDTMGKQQGFGASQYMRPAMEYEPGSTRQQARQRSMNNMPSDVQPVGRRRNYAGRGGR